MGLQGGENLLARPGAVYSSDVSLQRQEGYVPLSAPQPLSWLLA